MATIVTRAGKGSPLTNNEVDANFTNLNSDKLESGDTVASLTITTADINGGTIDGVTIGGASAGAGTFSSLVATTADINGGTIDGVTLGTNSAVTEAQIDNLNINGNAIISTDTNGNITLTPNGTGEVDISKVDIDGGTIDGTVIGGASAAAATFTDVTASGTINLSGATVSDGGSVTTVDINGGTIDGTVIGGSNPAAISGTTGTFSGNVSIGSGGNLVFASGNGIDFSATAGTGTSELFDDYEEGTWTPSDASGASLSFTVGSATYTKVGRLVKLQAVVTYPSTADASGSAIGGLPFTPANNGAGVFYAGGVASFLFQAGFLYPADATGGGITNAILSTKTLSMSVTYNT